MQTLDRLLLGVVALAALGIIVIGSRFLMAPEIAAAGFGVPARVTSDCAAYLATKGVRDIGWGLIVLGLLAARQFRALGVVLVAEAITAASDMAIVLVNSGTLVTALGVHGLTAILLIGLGLSLWMRPMPERR